MNARDVRPEDLNLSEDAVSRLNHLLNMDTRGYALDLVSPMLSRKGGQTEHDNERYRLADKLLADMEPVLNNSRLGYLWEVEKAQHDKIGSYSITPPFSEIVDKLVDYFVPKPVTMDEDILDRATEEVKGLLAPASLSATTLDAAFNAMPRNTNLGMPFVSKDKRYYPDMISLAQTALDSDFEDVRDDPSLHFGRGQPRGRGELPKRRHVWGFPHWIVLLEEMIQIPLLDALTGSHPYEFAAWIGLDVVDQACTYMLENANVPILSLDFSGFDASLPADLIHRAFDCIRYWFRDSDQGLIDFIEYQNLHIPIITPYGLMAGTHGEPSGSGVTNTIDTIVQRIAIKAIAISLGLTILFHIAQGDDGGVLFNGHWELEDITTEAKRMNLTLSSDKGGVSETEVYYLQNVYSTKLRHGGHAQRYRPLMKVINGMMSYERLKDEDVWNGYMDTLRWYQQGETANQNETFPLLVDFLWSNDRLSRQFGIREIIARAGGLKRAKSLLNERAFPYGKEPLDGIVGYRVVQDLQVKRMRRK